VGYDFSLKRAVVEVDRDADRRWSFATDKMKLAEDKGETFSDSAPLEDFQKKQEVVGKSPEGWNRGSFRVCFTRSSRNLRGGSKLHVCFDKAWNSMYFPSQASAKKEKKVSKNSFIS